MNVHDRIVDEFVSTRSMGALAFLIDRGRELEFSFKGKSYFLSRDRAKKYVSLWEGRREQSFDSVEELLEMALVEGKALAVVLPEIQIETIF